MQNLYVCHAALFGVIKQIFGVGLVNHSARFRASMRRWKSSHPMPRLCLPSLLRLTCRHCSLNRMRR